MTYPDWLAEAQRKREESQRVWATIPSADHFTRGQAIEALTRIGVTSGTFSGEQVEGDEFFARQPTDDIRSLLRDHWYLMVRNGDDIHTEPPDVPDVPEPEFKSSSCRCECGYTCGRQCGLPIMECMDKHYVRDCDHDFTGPWVEDEDGLGGSVTCTHCGMTAAGHDMVCGP